MAEKTADEVMLRKNPEVTPLGKLYGDDIPISKDILQQAFKKGGSKSSTGITIRPYVGFRDLNAGDDGDPMTRRAKPAIEIGIRGTF